MLAEHRHGLELFGSRVELLVGAPRAPQSIEPELAALTCAESLRRLHQRLSRFEANSELSRLNEDPRRSVGVSPTMMRFLEAAATVAELTGGLVDAALLDEVRGAGYRHSLVGVTPPSLEEVLAQAPARAPAAPRTGERWREVRMDPETMTVTRPPGLLIDSGGIAKGLAADLCAARLDGFSSYAVDCGGDLRIGGQAGTPRAVTVENPFPGGERIAFELARGAVATSGIAGRAWPTEQGFGHHLINPATGRPAWTGVVQATAVAPTAVEAEARAKAAVLAGPEAGLDWLQAWGGVMIGEGGVPEPVAVAVAEAVYA
jgi:thiamine biosynthesis lipoprotein